MSASLFFQQSSSSERDRLLLPGSSRHAKRAAMDAFLWHQVEATLGQDGPTRHELEAVLLAEFLPTS